MTSPSSASEIDGAQSVSSTQKNSTTNDNDSAWNNSVPLPALFYSPVLSFFSRRMYWKINITWGDLLFFAVFVGLELLICLSPLTRLRTSLSSGAKKLGESIHWNMALLLVPLPKRTSPLLYLFNIPYERALMFHKWLSYFTILIADLHCLFYLISGESLTEFSNIMGLTAVCCFMMLFFTSFPLVRRYLFRVFIKSHYLFAPLAYVFSFLHESAGALALKVCLIGSFFFLDLLVRLALTKKTRVHSVGVFGSMIRLELENVAAFDKSKVHMGDFGYLYIPQLSIFEAHPFSVAYVNGQSRLVFYIKACGPWTRRMASQLHAGHAVLVDGLYSSLHVQWPKYDKVSAVCGGSGIAAFASLLVNPSPASVQVSVHWIVNPRDQEFVDHIVRSTLVPSAARLYIYWTHASAADAQRVESDAKDALVNMHYLQGRPDVAALVEAAVQLDGNQHSSGRVALLSCGPESLAQSIDAEANRHGHVDHLGCSFEV